MRTMLKIKLNELPLSVKIAFICFYIFVILGFIFAHLILHFKLNGSFSPNDIISYYKGNEEMLKFQKTPLELSETSHFHAFISPVIALILSIFFSFSKINEFIKNFIIVLSFLSVLMLILNPWILTFGPKFFVYLEYITSITLIFSFLFMGLITTLEFFKPNKNKE